MFRQILIFFFLVTCCLINSASAQIEVKTTNRYSIENGLSQNSVWNLLQDKKGNIWISTADGLNKFDGHTFKSFRNIPNLKSSLSCNNNAVLFEDFSGKIWLTHQKGVSIYDPESETFKNRIKPNLFAEKTNPILGFDSNHRIWIWFNGVGLSCFTETGDEILQKELFQINQKFKNYHATCGIIMPNQKLYIGGLEGIITINLSAITFNFNQNIRNIYSSAIYNNSTLLWGSNGCIVTHFLLKDAFSKDSIPKKNFLVSFINKTHSGSFLIGSRYSHLMFDFEGFNKPINESFTFRTSADSLAHYECSILDRSNNLWLGTNFEGILKVNAPLKKIRHYFNKAHSNLIKAIIKDQFDNLYISNYEQGIDVYNKFGKKTETINDTKATLAFSDLNDDFLIGYDVGKGVYTLNKKTHKLKYLTNLNNIPKSFPSIANNGNSRYLIYNNFVQKIFVNKQKIIEMLPLFQVRSTSTGTLSINKQKDFLIANIGFLEIYDSLFQYKKTIKLPNAGMVKCITINKALQYLVATTSGLVIYDKNWNTIIEYNETNGLPNAFIYGVLEDEDSNLWLSHNKGITKLSIQKGVLMNLGKEDGLQSNEFNTGAFYIGINYELFFGGLNGVNAFFSKDINKNFVEANGVLTQFFVNDIAFPAKENLVLKYEQNTVSFEFSSNEYTNPSQNEFQYLLEGVDKNWILSHKKRFARYPNLPHGNYTFKLRCSNNDGVWSKNIYKYSFSILAPFYKRTWFYILCILLGILIIGMVFYLYYKRKLEVQKQIFATESKLQKQRERFSRDLHDNIGSRTSLLLNNLEVLSNESNNENVEQLKKNATDILQNLRETVWAMNKGSITVESLADKITQFIQSRMPVNSKTCLNIIHSISKDYLLPAEDFLNFYRIAQESINNSIKYSNSQNLMVEIEFSETHLLRINIADDGIGFTSNYRNKDSFGINNMIARANESKIQIEIKSLNGTQIIFQKQF